MRIATSPEPGSTGGGEPIRLNDFMAVINVSDTPCSLFKSPVPYYWFPISEISEWGYEPFFAAAKVVDHYQAIDPDGAILIHCHAGACRSPAVAYAIYMADIGLHRMVSPYENFRSVDEKHLDLFVTNMHYNWEKGHIPMDVIAFLKARHTYPTMSVCGLLANVSPTSFNETIPEKLMKRRALIKEIKEGK